MITDQHEMATLVAEKLYVKIKDDLITSGNGIINEVCIIIVLALTSLPFLFCLLTKLQTILGGNWNERPHRCD